MAEDMEVSGHMVDWVRHMVVWEEVTAVMAGWVRTEGTAEWVHMAGWGRTVGWVDMVWVVWAWAWA